MKKATLKELLFCLPSLLKIINLILVQLLDFIHLHCSLISFEP